MPSIFFISLMNGAPWGGSEEIWYKTALYCSDRGWKVGCAAFAWTAKEQQFTILEKNGCNTYRIPNTGRRKSNILEKIRYKFTKLQQVRFCKSLPLAEYDLVVINLGGYEICTKQWRNFYQSLPSYALVFHNYDTNAIWTKAQENALKDWMLNAKKNLFDAAKICSVLEAQLNLSIPKASAIINPITFAPPNSPIPFPELQENRFVLAMLAALDVSRKAQDNLVLALSAPKWKKRDWLLHLYGGGDVWKYLQTLIEQNHLENKVFL